MDPSAKAVVRKSSNSGRGRKPYKSKCDSDVKAFWCQKCNCSFVRKSSLTIHRLRQHPTDKLHKCETCNCRFQKKSELKLHLIVKHYLKPPNLCQLCGSAFKQQGALDAHMLTHQRERPFKCEMCDRRFTQKGNMKTHMRLHTNERPYSCSDCSQAFKQLSHLQTHIRHYHNTVKQTKRQWDWQSRRDEKPCEKCSAVFHCDSALVRHVMLKHSSEEMPSKTRQALRPKKVHHLQSTSKSKAPCRRQELKVQVKQIPGLKAAQSLSKKNLHRPNKKNNFHNKNLGNYKSTRNTQREVIVKSEVTKNTRREHFEGWSQLNCALQSCNADKASSKLKVIDVVGEAKHPLQTSSKSNSHHKPLCQSNLRNIEFVESKTSVMASRQSPRSTAKQNRCIPSKHPNRQLSLSFHENNSRKSDEIKPEHYVKALSHQNQNSSPLISGKPMMRQINSSKTPLPQQCTYCWTDFKQHADLLKHQCPNARTSHKSNDEMNVFNMQSAYKNFVQSNGSEEIKPYKCKLCPAVYSYAGELNMHVRSAHGFQSSSPYVFKPQLQTSESNNIYTSNFVMYKCEQCSAEFELRCHLLNHVRIAHRSAMIVRLPNNSNMPKQEFQQPVLRKKGKTSRGVRKTTYKCKLCDGEYSTKSGLLRHCKYMHSSFETSKSSINLDSNDYDGKKHSPYKCGRCNGEYKHHRTLVHHIKHKHQTATLQFKTSSSKAVSKSVTRQKSKKNLGSRKEIKPKLENNFVEINQLHSSHKPVEHLSTINLHNEIDNQESKVSDLDKVGWQNCKFECDDDGLAQFPTQFGNLITTRNLEQETPQENVAMHQDLSLERRSSYDQDEGKILRHTLSKCEITNDAVCGQRSSYGQGGLGPLLTWLEGERIKDVDEQMYPYDQLKEESELHQTLLQREVINTTLDEQRSPCDQHEVINNTCNDQNSPRDQLKEDAKLPHNLLQCEIIALDEQRVPLDQLEEQIKPLHSFLPTDNTKKHDKSESVSMTHTCDDVNGLDSCVEFQYLRNLLNRLKSKTEFAVLATSSNGDNLSRSQKQTYLEEEFAKEQTVSCTRRISYCCDQCNMLFWHPRSLMRHGRINHVQKRKKRSTNAGNDVNIREEIVRKVIVTCYPDLLKSGMRNVWESIEKELPTTMNISNIKTMPHICGKCSDSFELKKDLHRHLLVHAAERE